MSTRLQGFMFSLVLLMVLAVPQTSSAAFCVGGSVSGGNGGTGVSVGGSIGSNGGCGGFAGGILPWFVVNQFGLPEGSIYDIVATIISWLLALFGFLGILAFVISGIMYLLSAGDDDMAKKAKKGMIYAIIGIVVGLSGYIVMQAISGLLSGVDGEY